MTTATSSKEQLLTVSRGQLLEVFAAFDGAASFAGLDDEEVDSLLRPEAISEVVERLQAELIGGLSQREEAEVAARSSEYEAEMVEHVMASLVRGAQAHQEIVSRDERPAQLRLYAKRLRAADSIDDVRFPTMREVFDERSDDAG
jgi:hypothetical protein